MLMMFFFAFLCSFCLVWFVVLLVFNFANVWCVVGAASVTAFSVVSLFFPVSQMCWGVGRNLLYFFYAFDIDF